MGFEAGSIAPPAPAPPELMGLSLYSLEKEINLSGRHLISML